MATYLLIWNPKFYKWDGLEEDIRDLERSGVLQGDWSTGRRKNIQKGDRLFLIRLGKEPRGIVASGMAVSGVFEDATWDEERPQKIARYVPLHFDTILNADVGDVLALEALKIHPILGQHRWEQQISGTHIPEPVAIELELVWEQYLTHSKKPHKVFTLDALPEEVDDTQRYREGTIRQITVNAYERNPHARRACIAKHGWNCAICRCNFQKMYGEIGKDFIHVHHLQPLSEVNETYEVDPEDDLLPVCPNCHAMIHRKKPPYTAEEIQEIFLAAKV